MFGKMKNKITLDDIKEYAEQYRQYSNYIAMTCPFHNDTNPSLLVYDCDYYCKACHAHGTIEYLFYKLTNRTTRKPIVLPTLNRTHGIWKHWLQKFDTVENICKIAHEYVLEHGCQYFKVRKIDSLVQSNKLGYLEGWVTIPVFDKEHKIIGCVCRATPSIQTETTRYSTSPSLNTLFVPNWKRVINSSYIIVVYGIFDALGLEVCGLPVVTGTAGTSLSALLLMEFRKQIYIIPDLGEEHYALKLCKNLDWRGTPVFIEYPDGCKDMADIREKYSDKRTIKLIMEKLDASKMDC